MTRLAALLAGCIVVAAAHGNAGAQATLPYARRTLSFSGLGTSVHGDLRTVGMSGASAGLADTFIAAMDSPAGLAMTLGVGDIHFAGDDIHDGNVQHFDSAISTNSFGLALSLYPWAVGVGYLTPYREEDSYALQPLRHPAQLSVVTRELVVSAARLFAHNRLSLGVTLVLAQAERSMELKGSHPSFASYTAGATFGAMVQLPKRLLLTASFATPLHFAGASRLEEQSLPLPGFFQSVDTPWRASWGMGFIPNRFFRADVTVHLLGPTAHAALLRDEQARVGENLTVQPHLGAAYVFADFKELKATLFIGTYFEVTRIAGTENRLHGTAGIEARIWIFTVGGAFDAANQYRNYIVSVGADVFGVLARLKMIPPFGTPASGKMFPNPYVFSDVGLARPLVKDWRPEGPPLDPIKVGLGIPKNLERGVRNAEEEIKKIGDAIEATNAEAKAAEEKKAREDASKVKKDKTGRSRDQEVR